MNNNIFFKTLLLKGEAGQSIGSIEKTSTSGAVDTYTITLTDGTTSTFEVTNGSSIANIALTSSSGLVDTYTITLTDGSTTTFNVTNGEDFTVPADGVLYFEGAGVPDGYENSDAPIANAATEMSYARYQTLTDAEKTNGTIYMVYDDPTDNYVANNGFYLNYSTAEQLTGKKWLDNKPIYQKTFNVSANTAVDITSLNIDSVVDISGTFETASNGIYSVNMYALSTYYSRVSLTRTSLTLEIHGDNDWLASTGNITILYTKTTD